jgi:hypothetical protein
VEFNDQGGWGHALTVDPNPEGRLQFQNSWDHNDPHAFIVRGAVARIMQEVTDTIANGYNTPIDFGVIRASGEPITGRWQSQRPNLTNLPRSDRLSELMATAVRTPEQERELTGLLYGSSRGIAPGSPEEARLIETIRLRNEEIAVAIGAIPAYNPDGDSVPTREQWTEAMERFEQEYQAIRPGMIRVIDGQHRVNALRITEGRNFGLTPML